MRINLQTPYSQKDQVKALGAKWDATRGTWFIRDVDDLAPFQQWIPNIRHWGEHLEKKKASFAPIKSHGKTISAKHVKSCQCESPPWERCKHSLQRMKESECIASL